MHWVFVVTVEWLYIFCKGDFFLFFLFWILAGAENLFLFLFFFSK